MSEKFLSRTDCAVSARLPKRNKVAVQNMVIDYFLARTARLYTSKCSRAVPVPLATQNSAWSAT